ncbi:hypothetical protein [Naasia sp. SYSU D00948]|uniref:hypothetical protein n=1 Tax=Naasia sp. SYSU D00948 TaxID=2817379 RepID=UPI001B303168|nr:hypothetical protein [Naasia sp. SYSU D00948]
MSTSSTGSGLSEEGFDQTNAMAGDTTGESDGTAESELRSGGERSGGADATSAPGDDDDLELDGRDRLGGADPAGPEILPRTLGRDNEV